MYDNAIAQKVAKQYKQNPLTDFASVNFQTNVEELNLNWRERDLPEMERTKHVHRLHPYMGKFIPQLSLLQKPNVSCSYQLLNLLE